MYNPAGGSTYYLNSSISSTATSITLSSFTEPVSGTPYTMTLLNTDIAYGTIAPKTTSAEFISFTGITQNSDGTATLTGVTRGLAKKYPFTESTTFKLPHSGQSQFILSDAPQVFKKFATLDNTETITNTWTFSDVPNTSQDPVNGNDITRRSWVLAQINGGAVSQNSVVVTATAGESITKDQLVYLKVSDGKWYLCDADTASTVDNVTLGLAQGAGSTNGSISGGVLTYGFATLTAFTVTAATKYYASNTAGGISSSAGTTEVTIGMVPTGSTTTIFFFPRFDQQLTENEQDAIAGGGNFGTPSATNQFITQSYNSSATGLPTITTLSTVSSTIGDSTTQFDITNPSGTTFRYTWDSTGTNPNISLANNPVGSLMDIRAQNFNANNQGVFVVTNAGTNFFEVTNASGVAENDKTIGTGYIVKSGTSTWSKPANLKYIIVEGVAGGGGGGGTTTAGEASGGGGGGGYFKKLIQASSLSSTEYYLIGAGGTAGAGTGGTGGTGKRTVFGALYATAVGGNGGTTNNAGGSGGSATSGDVNIIGGSGANGDPITASNVPSGAGGNTPLGTGGVGVYNAATDVSGNAGNNYGGGGSGGFCNSGSGGDAAGGAGAQGAIIIYAYFS